MSGLPEDDGMRQLRVKMHEIRELAESTGDMARRMHALMVADYQARNQQHVRSDHPALTTHYNIQPQDLVPSFSPEDHVYETGEGQDEEDQEEESGPAFGCQHYKRNVKVQCFDCRMWFPCRHCHDASPDLPFEHHLNRKKTENMLCMLCHTPQPAGEFCVNCEELAAYYYCSKCKLWDNDSTKRIYHCDDCGICRRGEGLGRDFVHCKRCNVCISISTSAAHPCIERATDCDCPLCLDYLFSSPLPVVSLLCGHYMHANCYKDLMNTTYRCPVCNKSAVNMELQWRKLDDEIRMQPMPEDEFMTDSEPDLDQQPSDSRLAAGLQSLSVFQDAPRGSRRVPRKVWVGCNDCGGHGWTLFHWLGLRCPVCDGYNTNQMNPIGQDTRTDPIPGTQLQRQHEFTGAEAIRSFGGDVEPEQTIDYLAPSPALNTAQYSSSLPAARPSYFLQVEQEELRRPASSASHDRDPGLFSPYDILSRVGRSLSPMRNYLEGFDAHERAAEAGRLITEYAASMPTWKLPGLNDAVEGPPVADGDGVDFRGHDGRFSSGGEEDDNDRVEHDNRGAAATMTGEHEIDEDDDGYGSDDSMSSEDSDNDDADADADDDEDEFELFGHL